MAYRIGIRIAQFIPVLLGITFLSFCLLHIAPGDPVTVRLSAGGVAVDPSIIKEMRASMGLDKPFLVQYGLWLLHFVQGNMGHSYISDIPVSKLLLRAMPYTVEMAVVSMVLTIVVSVPLGILMAARQGKWVDKVFRGLAFVGNAVPSFIIGLILLYVISFKMHLIPVLAGNSAVGVILPSVTLALVMSSRYMRQIRAATLDELQKPYIIGLRSRGLKESTILFKNVSKNVMVTVITLSALSIGSLLGGAVIVETIFNWPGLGYLIMDAISHRDYPVVQAAVVWMSFAYLVINLIADLSYSYFNPTIKKG